jgi:hypothetical protein
LSLIVVSADGQVHRPVMLTFNLSKMLPAKWDNISLLYVLSILILLAKWTEVFLLYILSIMMLLLARRTVFVRGILFPLTASCPDQILEC